MSPDEIQQASDYRIEELLQSSEGVLRLRTTRAVLMTQAAYAFMMEVLREHAPHALKYAFYDMGYRMGDDLMGALSDRAEDPEGAFRYLVETYRQAGYGNLEVLHFDMGRPEARLAGTNLFETAVAEQSGVYRTPRCVDHYSRGMFAGFMSKLLGAEVACEEVTCEFRGDERCEFLVLPFRRPGGEQ
jgi:predicted hydrocarbon binding protein